MQNQHVTIQRELTPQTDYDYASAQQPFRECATKYVIQLTLLEKSVKEKSHSKQLEIGHAWP